MKNVYLLIGWCEHESSDVLGVYTTEEKAIEEKGKIKSHFFDEIEIKEFELE